MGIHTFDEYVLDEDRRELRRGVDAVSVEPQVFDVLLHLVRNRHRVVSNDDLLASVWRGRIVSQSTLSSRLAAVRRAVGDSGEHQRLIRTVQRNGYRFVGSVSTAPVQPDKGRPPQESEPGEATGIGGIATTQRLQSRPSIAILPFADRSADPVLDSLVEGVFEDVTTALSRFSWLAVTSGSSGVSCRDRWLDVREAGRELDVRYVLEGSARRTSTGVRTTARLIDAATGVHLWSNHFDLPCRGALGAQDGVTAKIIGAVESELERSEIERVKRKPSSSSDAYECYVRASSCVYQWTKEGVDEGLRMLQAAIALDPDFAPAYGMAAYCLVQRKSNGWCTDPDNEAAIGARLVGRAAELAREDSATLSRVAHTLAYVVGDVEGAMGFIERARKLKPNLPYTWYVSGWLKLWLGQPAMDHLTTALRLAPFHPLSFKTHGAITYAHLIAGRYDQASLSAANALRGRPSYLTALRGAAASNALAGRLNDAKTLVAQARGLDSTLCLSKLKGLFPFRRTCDFDRWAEGLQRAGVPD